uniref:gamma-soluble NSF attachment protein-like isoform X2 n=1 Tax=Myxine glutinosa TaxID=7769 RepID=UPI00358E5FE2
MADKKITEALEHLEKAEKYLKTGLLKWKPDYDSAAPEFNKAAVAFKNARQLDQAKEAYLQEAEAHRHTRALFHAAKAYEQAGMMLKEMQRYPEAVGLIEKACIMYQENGTPDTAALALERAARLVEGVNSDKAIELYRSAADVYETEERTRQAAELYGKVSCLLVRSRRLDEAAHSLEKEKILCCQTENYPLCFKKTIAQVLVHLHRNDYVAADKALRETYSIPGFSGSEDSGALGSLLEAYEQLDQDGVSRVCLSPLFKYMDNEG